MSSATTVYRWRDIVDQTGLPAFIVYNIGFFGGQVFGISLAHGISRPGAGAGAGIGFYVLMAIVAVLLARMPDAPAPSFWHRNTHVRKFWFLAFYSVSIDTVFQKHRLLTKPIRATNSVATSTSSLAKARTGKFPLSCPSSSATSVDLSWPSSYLSPFQSFTPCAMIP